MARSNGIVGTRILVLLGLAAVTGVLSGGCSFIGDARSEFGRLHSCPDDRITAEPHAAPPLPDPPPDIAADPERLRIRRSQQEDAQSINRYFAVQGCGYSEIVFCWSDRYTHCSPQMSLTPGSQPPGPPPESVARYQTWADQVCACTDSACARAASAPIAAQPSTDTTTMLAWMPAITAAAQRAKACVARLQGAAAPAPSGSETTP